MLPDYPSLKDSMMKERVAAFEREIDAGMPIVSKFKKIRFHEGHAYSLERTDGVIDSQEFLTIKEPVVISAQLDFDQTVSQVSQRMTDLAQDMATHMERLFASNFERITAEVGNAVNANGARLTLELYLDALDRIDIEFDAFGLPIWPMLSGRPETFEALRREFERFRSSSQLRERAEAIVRKKREDWRVRESSRRLVIRVSEAGLPPEYVYRFLEGMYERTRKLGSGNNQPALNKTRVEEIAFPLPPLAEQARIVSETERVLSIVASLESCHDKMASKWMALRSAVLRDAFSGKLVSQDPTDEPASVLLERIRAERAASVKQTPKTSKRGRREDALVAAQ